jgi:hypothetical protein
VEVLRSPSATGVRLVRTHSGQLFARTDHEILVSTKVLSYAEIAFDKAVADRRGYGWPYTPAIRDGLTP